MRGKRSFRVVTYPPQLCSDLTSVLWGWTTAMRTAPVLIAVVAALCSAQTALAQDSQYPTVPFYDWTGVYVGANLGYGSATINDTTTSGGVSTSSSQTMTGVLGGGQIGANRSEEHTSELQSLRHLV